MIFGVQAEFHPLGFVIVTFMDEYSSCIWVYLMKDRSKLVNIYVFL